MRKLNKKIIALIVSILLTITAVIISTYALFTSESVADDPSNYTTGLLLITAKSKSENISLMNELPKSDEDGINSEPYIFTIKNQGNLDYKFDIKLLSTNSSSLSPQYIKIKVDDEEVTTLSSLINSKIKSDVVLAAGQSIDVTIRVWLSFDTPNSEIGKTFTSQIVTDGQAIYTSTNTDINSNIIMNTDMPTSPTSDFFIEGLSRADIEELTILESSQAPSGVTAFDISSNQDGSVMLWYEDKNKNNLYEVYIGGKNGKVKLNNDGSYLFAYLENIESLDLSGLDTSNATTMFDMFLGCSNLTNLDLSNFDTSNVTDMQSMFSGCSNLTNLDLSNFDTSNVTDMQSMFFSCNSLTSLDLSNFNTSKVTVMTRMFYKCGSLTNLDLSSFDTSNVTNMSSMFWGCSNLTNLDLSSFDTSNVTNMSSMFWGCSNLTNLDLSNFNTSKVTVITNMFRGCSKLISLDIRNFDFSNVTSYSNMFYGISTTTIYVKDSTAKEWIVSKFNNLTNIVIP